jgi:hypothetical protein
MSLRRSSLVSVAGFFLLVGCLAPALAQEGHPMSGVWVGDWGVGTDSRQRVVIVLDWQGTQLSGVINPGPAAVPVRVARVDPTDWSVYLEAEARNTGGRSEQWVLEGKLDDLGTYNRSLNGSWSVDGRAGTFSITRQ